jgi:hypothetical protein
MSLETALAATGKKLDIVYNNRRKREMEHPFAKFYSDDDLKDLLYKLRVLWDSVIQKGGGEKEFKRELRKRYFGPGVTIAQVYKFAQEQLDIPYH